MQGVGNSKGAEIQSSCLESGMHCPTGTMLQIIKFWNEKGPQPTSSNVVKVPTECGVS